MTIYACQAINDTPLIATVVYYPDFVTKNLSIETDLLQSRVAAKEYAQSLGPVIYEVQDFTKFF